MSDAVPDSIRFVPSRVEGLLDVSDIAVFSDRIEFHCKSCDLTISFASIARRQEPASKSLLRRMLFQHSYPKMVADRDWFHDPPNRFFTFYTVPPITVFMPTDDVRDHDTSRFFRIQEVIRSGGFETYDLG